MKVSNCDCGGTCASCAGQGLGVADWVQQIITQGVNTAGNVITSRYGVPPAGTSVVQQNPDGSYQQIIRSNYSVSGSAGVFPASSFDTSTLIMFGVVALVSVSLFKMVSK